MADEEGDERRSRRMDLNLYLGLPRSPRPRSRDLGSDLALSSLPFSSSSSATDHVQSGAPLVAMSGATVQPPDAHPPYSPSHAEYTPDLSAALPADSITNAEYIHELPYNPYEAYEPSFPTAPPVIQDPEGADAPYSPSNAQPLPTIHELDESSAPEFTSHAPYNPMPPPAMVTETMAYSPPYVSGPSTTLDHEEAAFNFYQLAADRRGAFSSSDGGSSSRPWSPESRFRQLIESNHRWPIRRFRSSLSRTGDRFAFGSTSSPNPEQLVNELLSSQRSSECNGKDKVLAEVNVKDVSEEEGEDRSRNTANFECNICLDMAAEPVVTSCGHLFCWACLYQWLHIHSDHKECPVCKGEVTESNLTPIYGRGSSQSVDEKKSGDVGASGLKVPPRPRGNRFESFRQQYRPLSRRLGDGFASMRRILDQHMRNGNGYEARSDTTIQEMIDGVQRRTVAGLRARRLQREATAEGGPLPGELGLHANNMLNPVNGNANSILRDGIDFWHRFSLYSLGTERIAAITADLGRVVGRFANNSNGLGVSTSSVDSPNPEPLITEPHVGVALAADQASASSTMAVIQGEAVPSDSIVEPNVAGTSRSDRRRLRSNTSGSFDVDGGTLHVRKRRRLN